MTTRLKAFIGGGRGFAIDLLDVFLVIDFEGDSNSRPSRRVRRIAGNPVNVQDWQEVEPMENTDPSFRLSEEEARVLWMELTRHFNGPDDTTKLRQDYDSERKRVDKLIDHIAYMAGGLLNREDRSAR